MSDSSRPHGLQPPRLLRPWDFPGKNTGVGCHFLLQCRKVKSEVKSLSRVRRPHGLQPPRLLRPWDFLGKSTGVGCHFVLQGIFPTQGLNPGLLLIGHYLSLCSSCAFMYAKLLQPCPALCDPVNCNPPVSSVCGISQASILAISSFRGSSRPKD